MNQVRTGTPTQNPVIKPSIREVYVKGEWHRYGWFVAHRSTSKPNLSLWRLFVRGTYKVKLDGNIKSEPISGKFYIKK